MKKELKHFSIGNAYGGNQQWFKDFSMRMGGCAAQSACDLCIYSDIYFKTSLYPFDINELSQKAYAAFGDIMKKYLHPRIGGIDRLDIYSKGFSDYLSDKNCNYSISCLEGHESFDNAARLLKEQIDGGHPIAYLCLNHRDKRFKEYQWHWFIINGYDERNGELFVKCVTYGNYEWLNFSELWNSGKTKKGGMVLIDILPK